MATPSPTGAASSMATPVVTTVPTTRMPAPYWLLAGYQVSDQMNETRVGESLGPVDADENRHHDAPKTTAVKIDAAGRPPPLRPWRRKSNERVSPSVEGRERRARRRTVRVA